MAIDCKHLGAPTGKTATLVVELRRYKRVKALPLFSCAVHTHCTPDYVCKKDALSETWHAPEPEPASCHGCPSRERKE